MEKSQSEKNMNVFFQHNELKNIKNLVGIYMQDSKRFVKNDNMIEIRGDTTQGEYDPNYFKYKAYIEYDPELDESYIVIVKEN